VVNVFPSSLFLFFLDVVFSNIKNKFLQNIKSIKQFLGLRKRKLSEKEKAKKSRRIYPSYASLLNFTFLEEPEFTDFLHFDVTYC